MSNSKPLGAFEGLPEALLRLVERSRRQQKEIAANLDITAPSLSRILSGRNCPAVDTLGTLLQELNCTAWDLAAALDEVMGRKSPQGLNGPLLLAVLPMDELLKRPDGSTQQEILQDTLSRVISDLVKEHLASLTEQRATARR